MNRMTNRMQNVFGMPLSRLSRIVSLATPALMLAAASQISMAAQTQVNIGTGKDPNLAAQIVIAREKGYFKEAGLDVDVKYFPSGGDLMTAMIGGSVAVGASGATPVTTLRARPYPIRIVSQISDISGAQQIIVKQTLKNIDELYGKKIAIMRGTASEALFNSFVKAYGFDANKVELVNMAPAEMLASFARGTVDAIAVWEPNTTRARKSSSGKVLVSGTRSAIPGKEGERRIYGDHSVLFATEAFVREQPATIKAVLTALAHANDFIDANKGEANSILAKEFGLEPADMADVMASNRYTLAVNDELAADLDYLADFLFGLKRMQSKPVAREWIDPAILRAVRARLVTIK
jgi:ABC-type nitrate/sulfonate/bicarbonate transport system substrate-binding protein